MIPGRLRECLNILKWSAADLAEQLRCLEIGVTAWLDGRTRAPIAVAAWLEALVKAYRALPPPSLSKSESARDIRPIKLTDPDIATRAIRRPRLASIMAQSAYPRRATNATGARPTLVPGQRKGVSSHATHRFEETVAVLVGMGLPVRIETVMGTYALQQVWPAVSRNSAHSVALNTCKSGIVGGIDAETVRSTFVAFARRNDILVLNMDFPTPVVSTGSFSRANARA
jgi:hypothetical protein